MMTEEEFDQMERDLWLLVRDLKRDQADSRRSNKKVKLLLRKQSRNREQLREALKALKEWRSPQRD